MDKKALDERIDFKMLTEGCEKFNQHLIQLQSEYNKIVDPFNNARKSMGQNKEKYQIVAKLYNDRNRKIEDRKNQLHQKGKSNNKILSELLTYLIFHHHSCGNGLEDQRCPWKDRAETAVA